MLVVVDSSKQTLNVYKHDCGIHNHGIHNFIMHDMHNLKHENILQSYSISTGGNGMGEERGSEKTPRGWHIIRAKIGDAQPPNTVFVGRRPTGEIYQPSIREQQPNRDWILTRIMWLSGLEVGRNRLGNVDTMRRYIYIHGSPDDVEMGKPGSRGCIRMRNADIIELFSMIPTGTKIYIE